jgi:cytochrome c556
MNRFIKAGVIVTMLVGGVAIALPALGQGGPPDPNRAAQQAIDVRQSVMTLVSWNFSPLGGMMRDASAYNADRVQLSADRLSGIAPMIIDAFATDTREAPLETEALPVVWENHDDFNTKATALVDAIAALKTAADADNQEASVAAIGDMAGACRACHDVYRVD